LSSSLAGNEDYYPFKAYEEIIFKPLYTTSCLKEKNNSTQRRHCTAVDIQQTACYCRIMKTLKVTAKSCIRP